MVDPELSAKVNTSVSLTPTHSQTFLVSLLVLSALLAICSTVLLGLGDASGWVFLVLAAFPMSGAVAGWWKSQPDVDSENAHPTSLKLPDGTTISSDPRTMRDPQSVRHILQLLEVSINRKPLPDADGFVDADLMLIPASKERAQEVTRQINNAVQEDTNCILDALNLSEESETVAPVLLKPADTN